MTVTGDVMRSRYPHRLLLSVKLPVMEIKRKMSPSLLSLFLEDLLEDFPGIRFYIPQAFW